MSDKIDGADLSQSPFSPTEISANDQREFQRAPESPETVLDGDFAVKMKKPCPSSDKKVHFPQDSQIVDSVFEGGEAWRMDPSVPNEEVIDRYVAVAYSLDRKPLSCIIEQLSKITIPFSLYTFAAFVFKGIQLCLSDIEALEEVFKYCRCYHLSFENTNLERKALAALLEIIDYYACCSELCLARNKSINSTNIRLLATFLSGYPGLIWCDLRGVPILLTDAQALGQGIRGQFITTRVNLRKFVAKYLTQRRLAASKQPIKETDAESARPLTKSQTRHLKDLIRRFFTSPSGKTEVQPAEVADALVDVPTLCLRGLHLGETGICGPSLAELAAAIRIAGQLSDLRLPSNGLQPSDVNGLVNLLRFHAGLEVLDLSHNQIGDEGCRILASALSTPSYASSATVYAFPSGGDKRPTCNLRRLYLAANDVRLEGSKALAVALPVCRRLTHLELSDNEHLQCSGFMALQPGLNERRGLLYLGLARCGLACAGAIALAELLGDTPRALRRINLAGNHIAEAGLLAISRSLPFCISLVYLEGLEENRPKPPILKSPRSSAVSPRRRHSHNPKPSLTEELSELSLDILNEIHRQLAMNIDARLKPSGTSPTPPPSPSVLSDYSGQHRTFRGYVRFPVVGPDPRQLCGDSDLDDNEEDDDDDEEEPEERGADEQPTQPEGKEETKTNSDKTAAQEMTE
nr:unnamed protein product [Spirometra erinaceieuropaei]